MSDISEAHPFSSFVFLNANGSPYKVDGFRNRLERACVRAGLPKRSPYALRHYFGTKQAGSGINQDILAQLMGHTDITTTARYVAKVPDYHQKAVNRLQEQLAELIEDKKKYLKPTLRRSSNYRRAKNGLLATFWPLLHRLCISKAKIRKQEMQKS